jgi:hypothetical protein
MLDFHRTPNAAFIFDNVAGTDFDTADFHGVHSLDKRKEHGTDAGPLAGV